MLGKSTGLELGEVSYLFSFCNITISELLPLDCFGFIYLFFFFYSVAVKRSIFVLWSPVSTVGKGEGTADIHR